MFHEHLFSPELPCTAHLLKTSGFEKITMCNQDNARDIAAFRDEQSMKRSDPKNQAQIKTKS